MNNLHVEKISSEVRSLNAQDPYSAIHVAHGTKNIKQVTELSKLVPLTVNNLFPSSSESLDTRQLQQRRCEPLYYR